MVVASMYPASRIAYVLNVYYCQACMSRETDHNLLFIMLELSITDYCSLMMSPRGLWDPGRMAFSFSFHRIGEHW